MCDRRRNLAVRPGQYGSHFGQPAYDWLMKTVCDVAEKVSTPSNRVIGSTNTLEWNGISLAPVGRKSVFPCEISAESLM
jgi:hypothetical protein